jgi:hypothetical protein
VGEGGCDLEGETSLIAAAGVPDRVRKRPREGERGDEAILSLDNSDVIEVDNVGLSAVSYQVGCAGDFQKLKGLELDLVAAPRGRLAPNSKSLFSTSYYVDTVINYHRTDS